VAGGEDLAVEIGTFGDPFVGLEIGGTFVGPVAAAELGNIGDNTKGGLKGGQYPIQAASKEIQHTFTNKCVRRQPAFGCIVDIE
jgi:hypothetical protein